MGSCISSPKNKISKGDNNTECTIAEDNKEKTICKGEPKGEVVEVLYFHGKQRCDTCRAIEELTTEVINKKFTKELRDGRLQMSIIDITTHEGEQIADRYEVSPSSLLVNKWEGGKEFCNNMTDIGFATAKSNPEEFKLQVEAKLAMLLK